MLDAYKRRLKGTGNTMSEVMLNQNNAIMDTVFSNSINYRPALINGELVDIRFLQSRHTTINGDIVDYLLQFRPNVRYPIGTYVEIPNNQNVYETWIIFDEGDDVLFPKYNIHKCNFTLKWIVGGELLSCKVAIFNRSAKTGDINATGGYIPIIEDTLYAWIPTNEVTETIDLMTRFIISRSIKKPRSYKVTAIQDVLINGVAKLTLNRDEIGAYDNGELMIADFYRYFSDEDFKEPTDDVDNTYQLVGKESITINSQERYSLEMLENGEPQEVVNAIFSLTDVNGEFTDLATLSLNQEDNSIFISTASKKGTFILLAQKDDVVITKTIRIKGLL